MKFPLHFVLRLFAMFFMLGTAAPDLRAGAPGIAAGFVHSLYLKADGSVWATGNNSDGQLGDGTITQRIVPVKVLEDVKAVSTKSNCSLFLKTDGSVWRAGAYDFEGRGSGWNSVFLPEQVPGLAGVKAIAAAGSHNLFLKDDGTVWANGIFPQNGIWAGTLTPIQVQGIDNVRAIAADYRFSLFLKADGTAWALGTNSSGQLGDGTRKDQLTVVRTWAGSDVRAVSAGNFHSLFLRSDGSVVVAGNNAYGQLGTDYSGPPLEPGTLLPGPTGVKAIAAGYKHSLFLKEDGTAYLAGFNGGLQSRGGPVPVLTGVEALAAGFHSLFLKKDGSVWASGANNFGQLGDGVALYRILPALVPSGIQAMAGKYSALFLESGGTVLAAGRRGLPTRILELADVRSISAHDGSLFVKTDDSAWAMGGNHWGQLGDGTQTDRKTPVRVMVDVKEASCGYHHSLFLKKDGTAWSTGDNEYGQLADGSGVSRSTPGRIPGLDAVQAVKAGGYHSVFLKTDGTVWAAGMNSMYQLGIDSARNSVTVPSRVLGIEDVQAIDACSDYSLFLKKDGTVWVMGSIQYRITDPFVYLPRRVVELSDIRAISAGSDHMLFLKADGTVWAMGENSDGQLGDQTLSNRPWPVQVKDLYNVKAVHAGSGFSLFLKEDGSMWGAGSNTERRAGLDSVDKNIPVRIMQLGPEPVPPSSWQLEQFGAEAENPGIAGWTADPDRDGVVNLLERAFNLPAMVPGMPVLTDESEGGGPGSGASGLPRIRAVSRPGGTVLVINYLRLRDAPDSALTYTPEFSSNPGSGWAAGTGPETVETVNGLWERVTVEDAVAAGPASRFGRVRVTLAP